MQRRGFTLLELMIVVVIIGILAAISFPSFYQMRSRAKEANVKSNAHAIQVAAEDFTAQNAGVYATTGLLPVLPSGDTLADLVPASILNPFDAAASVVVWDGAAANEGEIGYDSTGLEGLGYVIDGLGRGAVQIISLTNGGS